MLDYVLNAVSTKTLYFQHSGNGVRYTGLSRKYGTVCLKYDRVCMKYNKFVDELCSCACFVSHLEVSEFTSICFALW